MAQHILISVSCTQKFSLNSAGKMPTNISLEVLTYRWAFRVTQDSIPDLYTYVETELHCQQQCDPSKCIILWVHLYIEQQPIIEITDLLNQIGINTHDAT
jgi:hypothetical protein